MSKLFPELNYAAYLESVKMPELTFLNLVNWIAAIAMIFGGVIPFIPQYLDIRRTRNAEGFSTFVCLNLLIANILRILFWFGVHFEFPLLAQSILMFFAMLGMVKMCVSVTTKSEILSSKNRQFLANDPDHDRLKIKGHNQANTFLDFDIQYFWKWTDFLSYIEFTVTFSLLVGTLTFLLINNTVYVECLGFMAVFAEAMLGSPQFYNNYINKSTLGMSKKMVGMWTCGDIFKTVYFILRNAPAQFWICGALQVSIDIAIFMQVIVYRRSPPSKVVKAARS